MTCLVNYAKYRPIMAEKKGKHPGGRPTRYSPTFHPRLAKALAFRGLNDEQIAEEMDIHPATYYRWKEKYPEFCEAIGVGKTEPDLKVEQSLYKNAVGYVSTEVHREMMTADLDGWPEPLPETPVKVKTIRREVPGNVSAQIFWLKNRVPDKWRDKREVEGSVTILDPDEIMKPDDAGMSDG